MRVGVTNIGATWAGGGGAQPAHSGFTKQQMVFTLSNFHEDLHGSCLAHPSLLVIQALQRPIWCSWLKIKWTKQKIKKNQEINRPSLHEHEMSENNLKNKNSLLVTSFLKIWDAESWKEKEKQMKKNGYWRHCCHVCPLGLDLLQSPSSARKGQHLPQKPRDSLGTSSGQQKS